MKYAHSVKLSVFSHQDESKEHVLESFLRFFPFSIEDSNVCLKKTSAMGFNERKIEILEITLAKSSLISQFLRNLLDNMDESQKKEIMMQIKSRLDKNLDFFMRFGKESWINEKKLILTDSGDCFHIRLSIAAFPKKREIALNLVKGLFSENKENDSRMSFKNT